MRDLKRTGKVPQREGGDCGLTDASWAQGDPNWTAGRLYIGRDRVG